MPTVAPAGHDYENHASLFCGADVRDFKEDMPAANFALAFEGLKWTDPDVFTLMLCQSLLGTYDKKSSNMQYATAPMVLALNKYKVRARGAETGRDWPRLAEIVLAIDKRKSRPHPLHLSDGARAPPTPQTHAHTHSPVCARRLSRVPPHALLLPAAGRGAGAALLHLLQRHGPLRRVRDGEARLVRRLFDAVPDPAGAASIPPHPPHTSGHAPGVPRGSCQSVDVKLRGAGSPLPEALSPCLCLTLPLPHPASALPQDEMLALTQGVSDEDLARGKV